MSTPKVIKAHYPKDKETGIIILTPEFEVYKLERRGLKVPEECLEAIEKTKVLHLYLARKYKELAKGSAYLRALNHALREGTIEEIQALLNECPRVKKDQRPGYTEDNDLINHYFEMDFDSKYMEEHLEHNKSVLYSADVAAFCAPIGVTIEHDPME